MAGKGALRARGTLSVPFKPPLKGEVPAKRAEGLRPPMLHGCGGWGVSSVMRFAHDSSFCGRSLGGISPLPRRGGGFPIAPATPSARLTHNLLAVHRRQDAAALSARRDHDQA